jgi:biopolymer transport protein ExbB/biopolymer transport protein TolQ
MLSLKLNLLGVMLLQEAVGFDLITMWTNMGILAKGVVAILAIMSAWSIGVMIDRFLAFGQARKQSREFAPSVAGCLREGKIEEAISVAEQNKRSHLAKVGSRSAGIPCAWHFTGTCRRTD